MRLTRATNYAVRALMSVARWRREGRVDLRSLARELGAPEPFLGKVLRSLARASLLEGARGRRGGYRLARPAREITLRDVIEAMEGRVSFALCLKGGEDCPRAGRCRARGLWSRLQTRVNAAFESETIEALAAEEPA